MLSTLPVLHKRYTEAAANVFRTAPSTPADDLPTQLTKVTRRLVRGGVRGLSRAQAFHQAAGACCLRLDALVLQVLVALEQGRTGFPEPPPGEGATASKPEGGSVLQVASAALGADAMEVDGGGVAASAAAAPSERGRGRTVVVAWRHEAWCASPRLPPAGVSRRAEGEEDAEVRTHAVRPQSFKTLVGRGHSEFSTGRQQDALEFYTHLMELVRLGGGGGGAVLHGASVCVCHVVHLTRCCSCLAPSTSMPRG